MAETATVHFRKTLLDEVVCGFLRMGKSKDYKGSGKSRSNYGTVWEWTVRRGRVWHEHTV
jgi:hypothetical protein